jgi:hypothetical protein
MILEPALHSYGKIHLDMFQIPYEKTIKQGDLQDGIRNSIWARYPWPPFTQTFWLPKRNESPQEAMLDRLTC